MQCDDNINSIYMECRLEFVDAALSIAFYTAETAISGRLGGGLCCGVSVGAGVGGIAANQNFGYCLWMLFVIRATARTRVADSRTTGRKYHLNAHMPGSTQGIRAVAPAGGCVVFVTCITINAIAVERDAASHCKFGFASLCKSRSNMVAMITPVRALKKWPKIRERGCARGTSIAPYMRIADAP